ARGAASAGSAACSGRSSNRAVGADRAIGAGLGIGSAVTGTTVTRGAEDARAVHAAETGYAVGRARARRGALPDAAGRVAEVWVACVARGRETGPEAVARRGGCLDAVQAKGEAARFRAAGERTRVRLGAVARGGARAHAGARLSAAVRLTAGG